MENRMKTDVKGMEKKKNILIVVVIFVLTIGLIYFNTNENAQYIGEVEGVMYTHTAEVSGKILTCPVQLGSYIKKGEVIAQIDDTNQRYAVEQLELNIQKAKLALGNTTIGQGGTADNNYNAAKAVYKNAEAAANKASEDYQNAQSLFSGAAISKEKLNSARLAYDTAVSALQEAKAKLDNIKDITASSTANLDIALLESQLAQQQEISDKFIIAASCDGTVMSLNYKAGDMIQPGYNIADISATAEKYVVFYYPKARLEELTYNQEVKIKSTESTNQETASIMGIIKYIDVKAQYTPKDLQTTANKNMESVKIKALLPSDCEMNPGQQVRVIL